MAVDGVSWCLPAGRITGLIGPNGAGKTTLFNLIAGSLRPSEGAIRFAGRDISHAPPHRRLALGLGPSSTRISPASSARSAPRTIGRPGS